MFAICLQTKKLKTKSSESLVKQGDKSIEYTNARTIIEKIKEKIK